MKTFKIACNCASLSSCNEMVTLVLCALFFLFFTGCLITKNIFFLKFFRILLFFSKIVATKTKYRNVAMFNFSYE